jgi:hypothetical protein
LIKKVGEAGTGLPLRSPDRDSGAAQGCTLSEDFSTSAAQLDVLEIVIDRRDARLEIVIDRRDARLEIVIDRRDARSLREFSLVFASQYASTKLSVIQYTATAKLSRFGRLRRSGRGCKAARDLLLKAHLV